LLISLCGVVARTGLTEQQDFYQFNDEYHVCTEDDRFTEDEDEDENAKYIKDGTDEC